ncbi:MAG TPA: dTDP-4-dehydrorhamnose 3,5-epimerase [Acidobacteriota bacterium]|nr:dTDP-4-dehydrorhamnose 3,5-epimerase [Acidobacteriota bacterium]
MIFSPVGLAGAFIVEPEKREDHRGFFARTWSAEEFQENGLNPKLVQCSISFNIRKGTLRGMHYQVAPFAEAKLVRCTMGKIFDAIVDLRPESSTFRKHFSVVLDAENRKMLYIPEGFAHGFQTLEDQTEIFYQMSQSYSPGHARGLRWNDPAFGISWPDPNPILLERDRDYPDFRI